MQGITFIVAIFGSVLVLCLQPAYALATYFTVLAWYPVFLRLSIGSIDISAGHIVVTVLLLRCLLNEGIRNKFVWNKLDKCVIVSMFTYVVIYCATHPFMAAMENRGAFLLDTWCTYIATRLIVTNKSTLISCIKCISVIMVTLAILGVIESVTVQQFFLPLRRFSPWGTFSAEQAARVRVRWGLARAAGPFDHAVMFGNCFVMFLPLIWHLRHQRGYWGKLAYPLSGIAIVGVISTMSSAPWVMLMTMIFCLVMERYKHWVKLLLITMLFLCFVIGIISNSPLHHVLASRLNPAGGDWWHRVRLFDVAIEHIGEWWFAGYGGRDPGWGSRYFYMTATDVTNQFILVGIEYGILGIVAICAVQITAFRGLLRAFRETTDKALRNLYWSLASILLCVTLVWMSVSFFGQLNAIFYLVLGIIGSSFGFVRNSKINVGKCQGTKHSGLIFARGRVD